jgi:hypothetical protein
MVCSSGEPAEFPTEKLAEGTSENRMKAAAMLRDIHGGTGGKCVPAFKRALDRLGRTSGEKTITFYTGSGFSEGKEVLDIVTRRAQKEVKISVRYYGDRDAQTEEMLKSIANAGGGSFYYFVPEGPIYALFSLTRRNVVVIVNPSPGFDDQMASEDIRDMLSNRLGNLDDRRQKYEILVCTEGQPIVSAGSLATQTSELYDASKAVINAIKINKGAKCSPAFKRAFADCRKEGGEAQILFVTGSDFAEGKDVLEMVDRAKERDMLACRDDLRIDVVVFGDRGTSGEASLNIIARASGGECRHTTKENLPSTCPSEQRQEAK